MNGKVVIGIMVVLALVAGAAGVGAVAYNAGVARGLAQSGELIRPEGGGVPVPHYGAPFFYPVPFFGFGFGLIGLLFPLLFVLLLFGLVRGIFWRGRWGPGRHGGPWAKGAPPMFEEWHRQAHETPSQPADK